MLHETDLTRVDLNLLVLFEAVMRHRHVGMAAEGLNLSPSAVSHGLGRLRRLLNDPLFLRTPRGVTPTERAAQLAEPVSEILARVRHVVTSADPFDPARSRRRFTIGMPDATAAVLLPLLLAEVRQMAPGISVNALPLLWEDAFAQLDARTIDIAVAPLDHVPARFVENTLYEEDVVVAIRAGHPYAEEPSLERYCELQHVVVSLSGDRHPYLDEELAKLGRTRSVAVAVPSFMLALGLIAETDLVGALPRSLVTTHGARFRVTSTETPLALRRFPIRSVIPRVAQMDAGVSWLFDRISRPRPA